MASWKMWPVHRTLINGIQLFKTFYISTVVFWITILPASDPATHTTSSCARPVLSAAIKVLTHEFLLYQERQTWGLMQSCRIRIWQRLHKRLWKLEDSWTLEIYLVLVREDFLAKGTFDLGFEWWVGVHQVEEGRWFQHGSFFPNIHIWETGGTGIIGYPHAKNKFQSTTSHHTKK